MTVALPEAVLPWKVTEQLPAANVQLAALKTPPVVPADNVKATEPVAVREARTVSVTVAAHVEVPPIAILFGVQTTAVKVASFPTAILNTALVLVLWVVSPP